MKRLDIWISNKKHVELHNAKADEHGFTLAMNKFADLVSGVWLHHDIRYVLILHLYDKLATLESISIV